MRKAVAKVSPKPIEKKPKAKKDLKYWMSFIIKAQGMICIVLFGVIFVYGLILPTPFTSLYNLDDTAHTLTGPFYATEPIISSLLVISFICCVVGAFYNVFRNAQRRIYYVSNYVYSGILAAVSLFMGIYTMSTSSQINSLYNSIDFVTVNAELIGYHLTPMATSTSLPVIGYVLGVICFIVAVGIVGQILYKFIEGKKLKEQIYGSASAKEETVNGEEEGK